jgi:hypothetical protein
MADALKAGDTVKKSGIYSVHHKDGHAEDHNVTCLAGKTFPGCGECGDAVRFNLVRHATHVMRHEQFKSRVSAR